MQYGKLYKVDKTELYKMQKTVFVHKKPLTWKFDCDTITVLGVLGMLFFARMIAKHKSLW